MEIELNLINHKTELKKIEKFLNELKEKIKKEKKLIGTLTDRKRELYRDKISQLLDVIGDLSLTRFEIRDDLEKKYKLKYSKAPKLAKELFNKHYREIHKPYDALKNEAHDLITSLSK